MKQILGLDLGSSSIGWAVISTEDDNSIKSINDMGCRIVPIDSDELGKFVKGQAISKNADRTIKRTIRKGYDRYQQRREKLISELESVGMMYDKSLVGLTPVQLWGLRAKAATEQISLQELGRVLLHLNQKRGYKSVKGDSDDKEQTKYVQEVNKNYENITQQSQTIGQYLFERLSKEVAFRCKGIIFPRVAYMEEFDRIISTQRAFYPQILTDEFIDTIRNKTIYYQRPLKSCKHLVSKCELEKHCYNIDGKEIVCGPNVAHRSSPLFQVCKIWESINNIVLENRKGDEQYHITLEQKKAIFDFMNKNEKLKTAHLYKILNLKKSDGWLAGKALGTGLQGNTTYVAIAKALKDCPNAESLLKFELQITESANVDTQTGEIIPIVDSRIEQEPLYRLWHAMYSISEPDKLRATLQKQFGIYDDTSLDNLCKIDFTKAGYGNKSVRAMRRILPFLMQGENYYTACEFAGYHAEIKSNEQNENRPLVDKLEQLKKGELRQPIVEKILNQMINIVNALMAKYGRFDEIRVELARELKQSKEEREQDSKKISSNQRENDRCAKRISEYNLTPTRSLIQKYKMWEETEQKCIYCNDKVSVAQFLQGYDVEVEHIIPKSLIFDDSFSNKVCSCRKCNQEKGNMTAYDYMKSKGEVEFEKYIDRVNELADKHTPYPKDDSSRVGISKAKQRKLLTAAKDIPTDFIDRQLRESQYIAKKSRKILQTCCHNVVATSGNVTDFLRHIWGYDKILHTLNLPRYRAGNLTEFVEVDNRGGVHTEERIKDWSKRLDHRHHAVDALTIALTRQGYIQRLNNLSSLKDEPKAGAEKQGEVYQQKRSLLERYILAQPHFSTSEVQKAVSAIAVSFKSGKKVATPGKRYIYKGGKRNVAQNGILIPRDALHEESVYGQICNSETKETDYVIKYPLSAFTDGKTPKKPNIIIDKSIRERVDNRLQEYKGNLKQAFAEPLLDHQGRQIRSVRCKTGLSAVVPLHRNNSGEAIAFVKPGNNHHVAIYEDQNGKLQEHVVTFWDAIERKKHNLPIIITNPSALADNITDSMSNEFLAQLPDSRWKFKMYMQQNEMFILGMTDDEFNDALAAKDYAKLSQYLYRVQKLSTKNYAFRHHIETSVDDQYNGTKNELLSKQLKKLIVIRSFPALERTNPHKVKVTLLGEIIDND